MDLHKNMNQSAGEWWGELSAFCGLLLWAPSSSRRREVLGVSSGMRLANSKQGISAVLAYSVKDATQNPNSHALADPAGQ